MESAALEVGKELAKADLILGPLLFLSGVLNFWLFRQLLACKDRGIEDAKTMATLVEANKNANLGVAATLEALNRNQADRAKATEENAKATLELSARLDGLKEALLNELKLWLLGRGRPAGGDT